MTEGQNLREVHNLARFVVEGRATGKQLGTGSYGSVEEIEVNGLICAGKRIHEVLIDANNAGIENVASKYTQECQMMSDLRHPNITLFLGVCFLPNFRLPVLLMERLDSSLDDLLEAVPNIPLALKRSMLEDVSKGLLYLHYRTPQIIHRDLTAKNVLLTSYFVAKITDLGNSRIVNLQPGQLARTMSQLPGTLVYMSPEALSASSRYGPSLDIFSFGHLALFTLLQVFPGQLLEPTYTDPDNPGRLLGRSEVERRQLYFGQLQLEGKALLSPLVKTCLHNDPSQRPTAEQLVSALERMKQDIEGPCGELAMVDAVRQVKTAKALKKEKADQLVAKEQEIQQLQQQLEEADERYTVELHRKDEEIQQKILELNQVHAEITRLQGAHRAELQQKDAQHTRVIQQLDVLLREKDNRLRQREEEFREELQQKDTQLQHMNEEFQRKDSDISRLQREIERLQRELERLQLPLAELKLPLNLKWRRGKDLPFTIWSYPSVVVFKKKVYIGGGIALPSRNKQVVIVYDPKNDCYDTLPPYTYQSFSIAAVNNQLVLVGGSDVQTYNKKTNKLGVWNKESKEWTHPLPPMITACSSPSVVTHNNRWLLVIGGCYTEEGELSKVEIIDTVESEQWYQAVSPPQLCHQLSTAVIGNMCYLLGGFTQSKRPSERVFSVCLDDLISESTSQPNSAPRPSPWLSLPDAPLTYSTALAFNGALLAVGGGYSGSSAIHIYQPSSNSWVKAGELPTDHERCDSGCTVLPTGEVLVAGGGVDRDIRGMVEIASVL